MTRPTLTCLVASSIALVVARATPARAQAEPAPEGYEPPRGVPMSVDPRYIACEHEARARRWVLWVDPRLVLSMGDGSDSLLRVGWGLGVGISGAFVVFGRSRLSLGVSFTYERRQQTEVPPQDIANGDTIKWTSHAAFSLDLKLDGLYLGGVLRPWVAIGPAMSIAAFNAPPTLDDQAGLHDTSVLGGLRAGVGLAGEVASHVEIGGRAEWLAVFGGDPLGNVKVRPYTPGNFSVGLDVGFRF
jgi:hypothetical protein